MHHPYLSVIIPAYNEASRLPKTLSSLQQYLSQAGYDFEVIVVSDGSTDETTSVVRSYSSLDHRFVLIDNQHNRGKGYAVKCGMLSARGTYRLFMDADNSVDISQLPPFLQSAEAGTGVTIGSIALGNDVVEHNGPHRRLLGSLSKGLIRAVATPGIYDTQRGFKLFSREAAELIFPRQRIDGFGFDIELIVIAEINGIAVKELPVKWDNPPGSKVSWKSYFTTLADLYKIVKNRAEGHYEARKVYASVR